MQNRLTQLIGKQFSYQGSTWLLIEVMPEQDSLVLRELDELKTIQNNQHGSANRRSPETLTLKISDTDGDNYSEEMNILLAGIIKPE